MKYLYLIAIIMIPRSNNNLLYSNYRVILLSLIDLPGFANGQTFDSASQKLRLTSLKSAESLLHTLLESLFIIMRAWE